MNVGHELGEIKGLVKNVDTKVTFIKEQGERSIKRLDEHDARLRDVEKKVAFFNRILGFVAVILAAIGIAYFKNKLDL